MFLHLTCKNVLITFMFYRFLVVKTPNVEENTFSFKKKKIILALNENNNEIRNYICRYESISPAVLLITYNFKFQNQKREPEYVSKNVEFLKFTLKTLICHG